MGRYRRNLVPSTKGICVLEQILYIAVRLVRLANEKKFYPYLHKERHPSATAESCQVGIFILKNRKIQ